MFGLIDEREGGIVAYFLSLESADSVAEKLNILQSPVVEPEGLRYTVIELDANNYADLLRSVAHGVRRDLQ